MCVRVRGSLIPNGIEPHTQVLLCARFRRPRSIGGADPALIVDLIIHPHPSVCSTFAFLHLCVALPHNRSARAIIVHFLFSASGKTKLRFE